MDKQRKNYLDILRILASFAVIVIHVSSQNLHAVEIGDDEWTVFKSYLLATNWAVPVFCMISGSLFLSRDISISKMLTRYLPRIAVAFVGWSLFYSVIFEYKNGIGTVIASLVRGYSHLWFLYMIAGLYLVTPLLRKVATDEGLLRYFVIVGFVMFIVCPELIEIIGAVSSKSGEYLNEAYAHIDIKVVSGYALYYMLGYYIDTLCTKKEDVLRYVALGILAYIIPVTAYVYFAAHYGKDLSFLFSNFSIGDFLRSIAIFSGIRSLVKKSNSEHSKSYFLQYVSELTFTVYLVHQFVITMMNRLLGINTLSFSAIASVPAISVVVFGVSLIIAACLNRILRFGRYIFDENRQN